MSEPSTRLEATVVERAPRYIAFKGFSPCGTDEKNQDRFAVSGTGSVSFAAVCDGATQSVCSADAAEILCSNPAELWEKGGLSGRIDLLRTRRAELMASEHSVPVDETSFLSRTMAEIVRDKQQHAFQTTLVAVRITPSAESGMILEAKTCGDSALLVFDRRGRLVCSNLQIKSESSPFGHFSPLTELLPDHFRDEEPNLTAVIDKDAHIVLCSDGFYDAFPNPSALFRWLLLNGPDPAPALNDVHAQLDRNRGDDDISFVWLCPCSEPPRAVPTDVSLLRRMLVALAVLLRRCADWLVRVAPIVPGGIVT
jgi:serine/threonine protein phosphatase PrpC